MTNEALRSAIDEGDVSAVASILGADPGAATRDIAWADGRGGGGASQPIGYICLAPFHGRARHDRMGEIARLLLAAGAPVDGAPDSPETPLVTAASYDEPAVAQALIEAGADLSGRGFAAPGGTALAHATYFGNPAVADALLAAGAPIQTLTEAAGAGRLDDLLLAGSGDDERAWALRTAAVCERVEAIGRLLDAGADIHVEVEGGTALHWAAWYGKPRSVRHLLDRGAAPQRRDATHGGTPLDWCRIRRDQLFRPSPGHDAVEERLAAAS
jgi:uncharacterized protein